MIKTKMISVMKKTKDLMDNPMPISEMNQLLDVLKTTGATHIEAASVIGHPNFAMVSKQWADAIHIRGMFVTWRCAHQNMEGLYGATKFVGPLRKQQQFWIDEAVNAFTSIKDSIKAGDEEAIYPERTESIFQDATSFLDISGLPLSYAQFFISLHNALKIFPFTVGLSANNASELLTRWMPKELSDYAGVVSIDHYKDSDPVAYEKDIRTIYANYGKPVYVQEGSPDRFTKPTRAQADTYYAANKRMVDDGVLVSYGSWSGWNGAPESIVDKVNGVYILNDNGKSLQAWWTTSDVTPTPVPPVVTPPAVDDDPFIKVGEEIPYSSYYPLTINGTLLGYVKLYKKIPQ